MGIAVIGAGHIGPVSGARLAAFSHHVIGVDSNAAPKWGDAAAADFRYEGIGHSRLVA